jgi:4-hydroxybenzoate polyprenyltransferase
MHRELTMRKILGQIRDEYAYNGHLISLSAVCIVATSAILLNIQLGWQPLLVTYLITFNGLLYNRYKEQGTDYLTNTRRTVSLKKYFSFIFLIIAISVLSSVMILVIYKEMNALIFLLVLSFACFLYTKYFKGVTNKIIAFKNIIFSLITSSLIIFLAIYYSYPLLNFPLFLMLTFVFTRMMVNTIFLDIKDIDSDRKRALLTLPVLLGKAKTLKFLRWLTLFSITPILIGCFLGKLPLISLISIFVIPYSFYYFAISEKKKNFYLVNYVLADSEFIFWLGFIVIMKIFI